MKTLLLIAAAATLQAAPTAAQFQAAFAAACPQRAETRAIDCRRADEASTQFTCAYEMRGSDGRWMTQEAILQQAEGEWVWIDGPTLCHDEEASLN